MKSTHAAAVPKVKSLLQRHSKTTPIAAAENPYPIEINHTYFLNPMLLTKTAAKNRSKTYYNTPIEVNALRRYFITNNSTITYISGCISLAFLTASFTATYAINPNARPSVIE